MVLKDSTIDKEVELIGKNLSSKDKQTLLNVSDKAWFRSYARKSKDNLKKLAKKVKQGIKKGGYTYVGKAIEEPRGFIKPKVKKGKKKPTKKKIPISKKKIQMPKKKIVKQVTPKVKTRMESAKRKYPDATKFELQHGVNSKASQKYRQTHNRPAKYEGRIKG